MTKKALLVGVNDYKGVSDLRGCVNDVYNMYRTLRGLFKFDNREIRALTDKRATKANILHRLKWLVSGAKAGDFLIFHFSGHGSQIRDRDGDEELTDGLDELICPHDMDWDGTFITDDDLNKIFRGVPAGALLSVYLDCCHSGSGLRSSDLGRPPEFGPENPILDRYLPPPPDILLRYAEEDQPLAERGFAQNAQERAAKHHILWAGCMDKQTSADAHIGGRYQGAFTYYFNLHLREAPRISRRELLRRVRGSLRTNGYSQIPQLEIDATQYCRRAFSDEKAEDE
jgi:metacaspase-1